MVLTVSNLADGRLLVALIDYFIVLAIFLLQVQLSYLTSRLRGKVQSYLRALW